MKKYRARFNPTRKGVFSVSLVDEPAMDGDFIQFKKDNPLKFAQVNKDKRRVMGMILEPDKEVLRYNKEDNSYYTVYFEKQEIEDVAYNFQKQGNQNNSTIQHNGINIEGVSFVETWIVEDSKIDKSANFGFEYPKGSWIGVMQLDNQKVWDEYVQTGKVKGFSIDAFMQFEEVNLNKVDMSEIKEDGIIDAIKKGFAQLAENPFKKKEEKDEKDMTPEELEKKKKADAKKLADAKKKADDDKVALEKVEADKVALAKEAADKLALETAKDAKVEFNADAFLMEIMKELEGVLNPMKEEYIALSKQINAIEVKQIALEKENETLKGQVVEFSKGKATRSVGREVVQKDPSKMTNVEKMRHNKENR